MTASVLRDPRALPQARRDLEMVPVEYRGRPYWTIKDPVALRYFQLREEERFILDLLDGRRSLDDIVIQFEERFAPRRLARSELAGFVALLHREGLVAAGALGQGEHLLARSQARRRQAWLASLGNPLAIRLPGINPDRTLTAALPYLAWIFSPMFLSLCAVMITAAAIIATVNFAALSERLPGWREFFGPTNFLWLALSLAAVKTLHELGHAVTCKRFGGEVNRLGLMLLVFTPALYCDVSDAWRLRDKWQRIAVSTAGMVVELVLAAAATLVWAMTQPGWINALALNVMFVCSVGTLLINGNPLLRYDGYYVLADWYETPNLQQQAAARLRRGIAWLFAGITLDEPRLLAEPGPLSLWTFGLASLIYRAVVVVGILWFVDAVLRPWGLGAISFLMATVVLVAMAAGPLFQTTAFLRNPNSRRQIRGRRLAFSLLLLAGILAAVLVIPLPAHVNAPVVTRPAGGHEVFVTVPGVLTDSLAPGEQVVAGQPIAVLVNRRLEMEVEELASRESQQQLLVAHLGLRQHQEVNLADQLPAAEERLADLREQLAQKRRDQARLTIVSPATGTLIPPPPRTGDSSGGSLMEFTGIPQEPQNQGCFLSAGTAVGTVAHIGHLEAAAIVEQADLVGLREGQTVRIALHVTPGQLLTGRVREIARLRSDELPAPILTERMIPLRAGSDGRPEPVRDYYQASIDLDPHDLPLLVGSVGWASIAIERQPLWLRAYRGLRSTFRTPW
jgi:putative peptide zinc metalloprotease protein